MRRLLSVYLVCVFLLIVLCSCGVSQEKQVAIDSFNKQAKIVNSLNKSLNNEIKSAEKLVKNHEKPYDEKTVTNLETAISLAKSSVVKVPALPDDEKQINKVVNEKLKGVNYDKQISDIKEAILKLENSIKQMKQITNPDEAFVIKRIKTVKGVTGISAVTEDNDPNGNLNKAGGYTSQVYFSYNKVNQSEALGNSIIDKGTDCGGSIEVYKTADDAKTRDSYLASFDGGVLASGSHTVLGTIVIRTSNLLTASNQKALEKKIISSFLKL